MAREIITDTHHPTFATIAHQTPPMTRLFAFAALAAGALYYLEDTGTLRFSSGGSGSSAISGYANASKPAINGIVNAAGG